MQHRTYNVTLTGATPLLLHRDNIEWTDALKRWGNDPSNKGDAIPGDDRTPAFRWIGCLYVSGGLAVIDADNLMTMMRDGGKRCPTGKGKGTFKAATQSGIMVNEIAWPLVTPKGQVPIAPILALQSERDFAKHEEAARELGFTLFVKRARVGTTKHIRVRPRFDSWSASGTLTVLDDSITTDVLRNILTHAGAYAGIGDWRPSSPMAPGSFGKFTVELNEAK